jgi:hypothetical protein
MSDTTVGIEGAVSMYWQTASRGWRLDVLVLCGYSRDRAFKIADMSWSDMSMIERVSVVRTMCLAKSVVGWCGI